MDKITKKVICRNCKGSGCIFCLESGVVTIEVDWIENVIGKQDELDFSYSNYLFYGFDFNYDTSKTNYSVNPFKKNKEKPYFGKWK